MKLAVVLASVLIVGCPSKGDNRTPGPVSTGPTSTTAQRPDHQINEQKTLRCRDQRSWGSYLRQDVEATTAEILAELSRAGVEISDGEQAALKEPLESIVKWRLIRFLLVEGDNHNFGSLDVASLKTDSGKPVRIYRTGFTSNPERPESCFHDLLARAGVRHVVSLYAGEMPTQDLEAAEKRAATASGATYFSVRDAPPAISAWRYNLRDRKGDPGAVRGAMEAVAKLINEQIVRPQGKKPSGNIHVHCAGGMHRTGMVLGVVDRCINGASMADVEADYRHHVGWRSDDAPGGYEAGNLEFVRTFDCGLLDKP